jgi:hypothetical protein
MPSAIRGAWHEKAWICFGGARSSGASPLKPKGKFTNAEVMIWLITKAAFQSHDVSIRNGTRREIVQLQRGQIAASIRYLATAWNMDTKGVQRILACLASDLTLTTETATGQTVITLCNWGKHQRPFDELATDNATESATETPTKKKELKEGSKNNSAFPAGFLDWWAIYPRHCEQPAAVRNFKKLMRAGTVTLEVLLAATRRYAVKCAAEKTETNFIKKPANWIRDGGYDDAGSALEAPAPVVRDPRSFTEAEWLKRVSIPRQSRGL